MAQGVEAAAHRVLRATSCRKPSDKLTGLCCHTDREHAGIPEVIKTPGQPIVSVLKVVCLERVRGLGAGASTFGLWHASGYEKRSKLRCCNAA
ncbi:hypothetical protein [Hydrogenophaga sp.]|uniref:hypothetical protein n=1 Tax=Hydrogenophaga sp. TaxID=1904254 RepID=UPI00272FCAA4|nr:hypothetical protein [Hydrogenophaga sp.]MDP2018763.1 hypothetical protein [Hydrogenophaga sp.]MDP3167988.1 hypothetical protein [Hydrogenophaga sp.]MDP3813088.1 hypothetical protein [Hydrogenophaga sp.]